VSPVSGKCLLGDARHVAGDAVTPVSAAAIVGFLEKLLISKEIDRTDPGTPSSPGPARALLLQATGRSPV
jgi:hypothetical protein